MLRGLPPPGGISETVETADGMTVRVALWPCDAARGTVVVTHGRTEFIEKYYPVIAAFLARRLNVITFDWRGQGLSARLIEDRLPGHIDGFAAYQNDLDAVLGWMGEKVGDLPVILTGHSMGGCIAVRRLSAGGGEFAGAILTAPMLGLYMSAPMAAFAGRTASLMSFLGHATRYVQGSGPKTMADFPFENNVLTPDRDEFERYTGLLRADPDLGLGGPTWGWLHAAFMEMTALAKLPEESIAIPVLLVMPEEDRVVSNAASRRFAARNGKVELLPLPGSRHEPYLAPPVVQEILWREIDTFLDRTLA